MEKRVVSLEAELASPTNPDSLAVELAELKGRLEEANAALRAEKGRRLKNEGRAERVVKLLPQCMLRKNVDAYMTEALDLERTLRDKMAALPPGEFERLLHPVFEEDEFKLIILGGILGVCIGLLQNYGLGG